MLESLVVILLGTIFCLVFLFLHYSNHWKPFLKKNIIRNLLREYWRLLTFIIIALILSTLRAILVDRPIIVSDGYDDYAVVLARWLGDTSIDLDATLGGYQFPIRMVYSLILAIPSSLIPVDIVLLGRAISIFSFLVSIPLLYRIINFSNLIKSKEMKEIILILYVTNVTLMTNLVRFGTDMLFLVFLMAAIVIYLEYISRPFGKAIHILFPLAVLCILLLFTREVGFLFCGSLILHQFYLQKKKIKIAMLGIIVIGIIASALFGVLDDILFYLVWTATSHSYADALIRQGDLSVLIAPLISKFLSGYNLFTTIESVFYAFGMALLFSIIGIFYMYKHPEKREFLRSFIFLYLLVFVCFYVFLKIGRGLDRFFLPVLFIPYLMLPFGIRVAIYGSDNSDEDEGEQIPEKERLFLVTLILSQLFTFFLRVILSYIS